MALQTFHFLKYQIKKCMADRLLGQSLAPHAQEILEFVSQQVQSSELIAKKMLLGSTSRLDLEIRVAVSKLLQKIYALQDTIQTSRTIDYPTEQLEDLKRETLSFSEMLKNMAAATEDALVAGEDDDTTVSSRIKEPKMVGLSDQYKELKHQLMHPFRLMGPYIVVIVGMAGIGKTTLASQMFEDSDIVAHYDCRVWVTVGRKCKIKEIPRRILAAVDPAGSGQILAGGDDQLDQLIAQRLREFLDGKRYLIVLDDVWNRYMACQLHFYNKYNSFESNPLPWDYGKNNEGRVLITTRVQQQREEDGRTPNHVLKMRLLDKEESWDLLRKKVFGEDQSCPPQLEKDGKKIAEKCQGLPLMIVTVANLLSKEEKTPEFWKAVAAKKNHKIFMDAYEKISKVLSSSYDELTHELRKCFLYMGVFPQDLEIPRSKIMNMWGVDGFLELPHTFQNPSAIECLDELISNSVVMIYQSTIGLKERVGKHQIKTCGLHSSLWHLSRKEGTKTKFCHVLSVCDDISDIQGQSRLSFHNNVLFGIKDVCELVESECASSVRSLLCYGPYHQYQVPLCFGLKLLRELDALTVRFYGFPIEVLKLVELKYLALTLNGELPSSISKFSKLQFLIVRRHMSIRSCKTLSFLPVEIWDMKELKHIQVMTSDLPRPCGSLENLSTLSNVSGQRCNEGVLKATPNLKKLGIRVELLPNDGGESLGFLDHVCHLEKLESLKYVIVNPDHQIRAIPLDPLSMLTSRLRKLSLSGLGCFWSEMSKIAPLLWLQVLKLRSYAFRGPKWEVNEKFWSLKSLVIEDSDLEEWTVESDCLECLKSLRIKHCYKLKRITWNISNGSSIDYHWACYDTLEEIELEDCNPLGVDEMNKALPPWRKDKLIVYSSWKEKKLKTW